MQGTVNISDLVAFLMENDLVMVSRATLKMADQDALDRLRHRYMKRKALKLSEIVAARLLPLKSKNGIQQWITSGKIKNTEVIVIDGVVHVATAAIRRLGYHE